MNMVSGLPKSPRRLLAIMAVVAMTPTAAHADFFGDTINGAIVGGPGAFAVVPPTTTITGGVEFVIEFVGTPTFEVDLGSLSFELTSVFGSPISTGAGEVLVIDDLNGINNDLRIIGITNFQTNQGPDITIDDVSFTDNEVRFNMSPHIWDANAFVSWDFQVETVPAPSALALMGIAGLISRRRRRR